jgi:hypothetical protein
MAQIRRVFSNGTNQLPKLEKMQAEKAKDLPENQKIEKNLQNSPVETISKKRTE